MQKKWCPRCDQGWVIPVRILSTGEIIQCCSECEAVWGENVDKLEAERYSLGGEQGTFCVLVPYLEVRGIRYGPGSVENVYSGDHS